MNKLKFWQMGISEETGKESLYSIVWIFKGVKRGICIKRMEIVWRIGSKDGISDITTTTSVSERKGGGKKQVS